VIGIGTKPEFQTWATPEVEEYLVKAGREYLMRERERGQGQVIAPPSGDNPRLIAQILPCSSRMGAQLQGRNAVRRLHTKG
jgi:hypothetical protein